MDDTLIALVLRTVLWVRQLSRRRGQRGGRPPPPKPGEHPSPASPSSAAIRCGLLAVLSFLFSRFGKPLLQCWLLVWSAWCLELVVPPVFQLVFSRAMCSSLRWLWRSPSLGQWGQSLPASFKRSSSSGHLYFTFKYRFLSLNGLWQVLLPLRASPAMLPKTHPLLLCLGCYLFSYYLYFVVCSSSTT
jgi:hypothetical protein